MNTPALAFLAFGSWTKIDVLTHLWQSTVVGMVVLVVLMLGRGLSARTRRALGWMALIKFALPAGILVQTFARLGAAPERWVGSGALAGPIMLPAFAVAAPAVDAPARVSAGLVLTLVWLAGFVALFVSWLVRGRSLRRQIFAEVQPVTSEVEQRIAAAADRVGLREIPHCLVVGCERAPGVLGVIAPIVVLPRGLETTLAPAELESVLIHEFVHVQRRDNLWSAGQALLVSLFWFHPIVWWLNRRIGLETEQACDERVLEITGDPDTYAGGIVKAVRHALGVAQPGLMGATTPPVIARLKNIFSHQARRDRPFLRGTVLAGGAGLLALSGYAGSFAAPALAPDASAVAAPAVALLPKVAPVAAAAPAPAAPPAEAMLSVDFPDESIRNIIRNVADLFQLNVVMPETLKGKTTVKFRDVTWRQIFRIVLAPVGYTFVEEGNMVRIVPAESLGAMAAPAVGAAPIALASLPALAAEARLTAQADRLKSEAEVLQREVDAANAARSKDPAAAADPDIAVKAASLAAIDARRQALDTAVSATADSARWAAIAEKRASDAQQLRALSAEDRAKAQPMVSIEAIDTRLKARADASPTPKPSIGLAVEAELNRMAKSQSEEVRALGLKVYELGQLDRVPVAIYQARPQYPFALRRANTSGEATIDFVVNEQGDVVGAYAVKFTHEEFAGAAIAAVAKWKFRPGRRGGAAVNTHMQVPIVFTLNENN